MILKVLSTLAMLLLVASFQQCTRVSNSASETDSSSTSGNGGHYDGKLKYVVEDKTNPCADGSVIRHRIDNVESSYVIVRLNCMVRNEVITDNSRIQLLSGGRRLVFDNATYELVRDPFVHPFSSQSVWNAGLGSLAQWSAASDIDTRDLRTPGGAINAGQWSTSFYRPSATDQALRFRSQDPVVPLIDVILNTPANAQPGQPAGNGFMVIYDLLGRSMYGFNGCQSAADGFLCSIGQRMDVCGQGLEDSSFGPGFIRAAELREGLIKHALAFGLPKRLVRAGTSSTTGLAWPAVRADYDYATTYSGQVLYGSTIGIPASVDINTLGLSPGGLVLAKALQQYGAMMKFTGGNNGIIFYAEDAAEGLPILDEMRADLNKLIPVLSILRNQAPTTPNGGGASIAPSNPPIDPDVCPI